MKKNIWHWANDKSSVKEHVDAQRKQIISIILLRQQNQGYMKRGTTHKHTCACMHIHLFTYQINYERGSPSQLILLHLKSCSQGCHLLCKVTVIVVPTGTIMGLPVQLLLECKFLVPVLKSNEGISCILEPAAHSVNGNRMKQIMG